MVRPSPTPAKPTLRGRFSALASDASPALLASLLHASLSACALPGLVPPWAAVAAAFLALVPMAWVASAPGRAWPTFLGIWLGQVPLWALQQWWVLDISQFGFFPMVALQASWAAIFVSVTRASLRVAPRLAGPVAMAVVWTGVEFLRGRLFLTGYALGLSGEALIDVPLLASPARVGGSPRSILGRRSALVISRSMADRLTSRRSGSRPLQEGSSSSLAARRASFLWARPRIRTGPVRLVARFSAIAKPETWPSAVLYP